MSVPNFAQKFVVESDNVKYTESEIIANYEYRRSSAFLDGDRFVVRPTSTQISFKTERNVPKVGLLVVGLGGNNGSTLFASIVANQKQISWSTATGVKKPNYYGSITQSATVRIGSNAGQDCWVPLKSILPMVEPNDLVIHGWDISNANMAEAMRRAKVLDYDLQRQLEKDLQSVVPIPSIFDPDFIAGNQSSRANHVFEGSKQEQLDKIRADIRKFKEEHKEVEKVILLWSANTERFAEIRQGVNDTADNLLSAIEANEPEISPSTIFAVASILEGCTYINGSPQNTFVPGVIELSEKKGIFIAGDDFKSGQTKMKSVMADWLIGAGIKPRSIVSYNHLGNNDGKNLSAPAQFRSKEITKASVVDDMVTSNPLLYAPGEHPDHVIVIKYVPYVGDSKRALDEYSSEIFMGAESTIVMHNTCPDSFLAAPIMIDLVIMAELMSRIQYKVDGMTDYEHFHPILSILSYFLKAPLVPAGAPVVNALQKQRSCIENILKACVGLPPENDMQLEHKFKCDSKLMGVVPN